MIDDKDNIGRVWHGEYPEGVPYSIDDLEYDSVTEMMQDICQEVPDNKAFISFNKSITYREFEQYSARLAAYMQQKLGIKKGDRVAIMLPNLIQFPVALFAILKIGAIVVNINPLYTSTECEVQLNDAGCETIFVLGNFIATIEKIYAKTQLKNVIITNAGDMLGLKGSIINGLLKYVKRDIKQTTLANALFWKNIFKERNIKLNHINIHLHDIAFLQYTGGTTGVAKGAMLSHKNMLSNIIQGCLWVKPLCEDGKEMVVTALPLYHIFSLTVCLFCFIKMRSANLLIVNPRDTKGFIKDLIKHKASAFVGLNTLFISLLKHKDFTKIDFTTYKLTITGGMPLQKEVAAEWQQVTKIKLIEGYGLTEAAPLVSCSPVTHDVYNHSIGVPIPATEVEFRDNDGNVVPQGESGELCVRGPQVMEGYWNKPAATEDVIDAIGWLKTGDIGYMDKKGYLYIVDRKKDMIIVSGFNVYPNEVEAVLLSHPLVQEAAVIGVNCAKAGEKIKAFIVRKEDSLTEDEIIKFCREQLTAYKVPKIIEFVDSLPKSNVGKVLRRSLREQHAASERKDAV
jgi:long-chain acyl-CoA synthetase